MAFPKAQLLCDLIFRIFFALVSGVAIVAGVCFAFSLLNLLDETKSAPGAPLTCTIRDTIKKDWFTVTEKMPWADAYKSAYRHGFASQFEERACEVFRTWLEGDRTDIQDELLYLSHTTLRDLATFQTLYRYGLDNTAARAFEECWLEKDYGSDYWFTIKWYEWISPEYWSKVPQDFRDAVTNLEDSCRHNTNLYYLAATATVSVTVIIVTVVVLPCLVKAFVSQWRDDLAFFEDPVDAEKGSGKGKEKEKESSDKNSICLDAWSEYL